MLFHYEITLALKQILFYLSLLLWSFFLTIGKAFAVPPFEENNAQLDQAWKFYILEQTDSALYYFNLVSENREYKALASFYIAKIYEQKKDWSSALSHLTEAVQIEYRKEYWELMLSILEEMNAYPQLKEASYFLIEKEGVQSKYLDYLLTSLELTKVKKKDLKYLKNWTPFNDLSLNTRAIVILVDAKEYNKVFEILDLLIERNPWDAHFYLLKISLFNHLGAQNQALQLSEQVLYQFPLNRIIQVNFFLLALQSKEYEALSRVGVEWLSYKPPISEFYNILTYMIMAYSTDQPEVLKSYEILFSASLQPSYINYHNEDWFEFIAFAYRNQLKDIYWQAAPIYFSTFKTTYEQRVFYLKSIYRDRLTQYESELFSLIADYPRHWELYEKAIKFYEEQGRVEDLNEMKKAYLYERFNSEE